MGNSPSQMEKEKAGEMSEEPIRLVAYPEYTPTGRPRGRPRTRPPKLIKRPRGRPKKLETHLKQLFPKAKRPRGRPRKHKLF